MKNTVIDKMNEDRERAEFYLALALEECRLEGSYVPLDSIINIMKNILDESEITYIKENL